MFIHDAFEQMRGTSFLYLQTASHLHIISLRRSILAYQSGLTTVYTGCPYRLEDLAACKCLGLHCLLFNIYLVMRHYCYKQLPLSQIFRSVLAVGARSLHCLLILSAKIKIYKFINSKIYLFIRKHVTNLKQI
jgi:hypothetical protein